MSINRLITKGNYNTMAARTPVKIDSNNLKEMSADDKTAIINRAKWLYLA